MARVITRRITFISITASTEQGVACDAKGRQQDAVDVPKSSMRMEWCPSAIGRRRNLRPRDQVFNMTTSS
jgi:hypothetical protein